MKLIKLAMTMKNPSSTLLGLWIQNKEFMIITKLFSLYDVMFVTTANTLNILPPLKTGRIRLSGYTEDEKVNISQKYLIPNQSKNNGLKKRVDNDKVLTKNY